MGGRAHQYAVSAEDTAPFQAFGCSHDTTGTTDRAFLNRPNPNRPTVIEQDPPWTPFENLTRLPRSASWRMGMAMSFYGFYTLARLSTKDCRI